MKNIAGKQGHTERNRIITIKTSNLSYYYARLPIQTSGFQPDTSLPRGLFDLVQRGDVRYFGEPFKQEPAHKHLIHALEGRRGYQVELRNMRPFSSVSAISEPLTALETWNIQDNNIAEFQPLKERLTHIIWKQILGCGTDAQSLVYTSGTNANYQAIRIAGHYLNRTGQAQQKMVVLSSGAHQLQRQQLGSTSASADGNRAVLEVEALSASKYAIDQKQLLAVLSERNDIGILQLTAGTTNLGTIEGLSPEIERICLEKNIWVHVDAAFGGLNIGLLPDHPSYESSSQVARLKKLISSPTVRSVVVDPHKFIGPYNLSLLIFPNRTDRALSGTLSYFDTDSVFTPSSQGARELAVCLKLMDTIGLGGMRHLAYSSYRAAWETEMYLRQSGHYTIMERKSPMLVVNFSCYEEREFVHKLLAEELKIKTARFDDPESNTYGIRLVFSPIQFWVSEAREALAKAIVGAKEVLAGRANIDSLRTSLNRQLGKSALHFHTQGADDGLLVIDKHALRYQRGLYTDFPG